MVVDDVIGGKLKDRPSAPHSSERGLFMKKETLWRNCIGKRCKEEGKKEESDIKGNLYSRDRVTQRI